MLLKVSLHREGLATDGATVVFGGLVPLLVDARGYHRRETFSTDGAENLFATLAVHDAHVLFGRVLRCHLLFADEAFVPVSPWPTLRKSLQIGRLKPLYPAFRVLTVVPKIA